MATLNYENGKFIFRGSFAEREIPKSARFRWDSVSKLWWTDDKTKAATLIKYASATARSILVEEHNKMVKEENIQPDSWAYAPPSSNDEPEYQVVLASLKRFEELGYDARVVFWFDN